MVGESFEQFQEKIMRFVCASDRVFLEILKRKSELEVLGPDHTGSEERWRIVALFHPEFLFQIPVHQRPGASIFYP